MASPADSALKRRGGPIATTLARVALMVPAGHFEASYRDPRIDALVAERTLERREPGLDRPLVVGARGLGDRREMRTVGRGRPSRAGRRASGN